MARVSFVLLLLLAFLGDATGQAQRRGSLYGWVVVLDPGHGGMDPGASRFIAGKRVVEDEYVFDVALRVERLIRARQGVAFKTITDAHGVRDLPANEVFPDARTERFALDGTIVRAGTRGLNKRLAFGNRISRQYPKHRQAWISIHFDVLGTNRSTMGVRIIAPNPNSRLARSLGQAFGDAKRLRDHVPIAINGDRRVGLRRLHILNTGNTIQERVLIELGNFNNEIDMYRIRAPNVREAYANAIVQALEKW